MASLNQHRSKNRVGIGFFLPAFRWYSVIIVLGVPWCDIVWNAHAPTEVKGDYPKDI